MRAGPKPVIVTTTGMGVERTLSAEPQRMTVSASNSFSPCTEPPRQGLRRQYNFYGCTVVGATEKKGMDVKGCDHGYVEATGFRGLPTVGTKPKTHQAIGPHVHTQYRVVWPHVKTEPVHTVAAHVFGREL